MNLDKPTWAVPLVILGGFLGWKLFCAGCGSLVAHREAREQAVRDIDDAARVASRAFGQWAIEDRTRQLNAEVVRDLTLAALSHATVAEVQAYPVTHQDAPVRVAWLDDVPTVTPIVAGVWEAVGHFHDLDGIGRVYRVAVVRGRRGLEAAKVDLLPAEAPDGQEKD